MAIALDSLDAAVARAQLLMGRGRKILGLVGKLAPLFYKKSLLGFASAYLVASAFVFLADGYALGDDRLRADAIV